MVVDVASFAGCLDAGFAVGADAFKRRRVYKERQIECAAFLVIYFVGVVGVGENFVVLGEPFQEQVDSNCRVVFLDVIVKSKGGA